MAPAKFERIISVSSEDPAFPAENLLKNAYSDRKWKSKTAGERQISVVLQLEKAEIITGVDVGNCGSALIEILVSKSSSPDDFKVLVVASSLMSLQEAKLGTNMSNVRFFKEESLVQDVASDKWDRIKLVCSQPYNKLIQFGLAFIVIHTKSSSDKDTQSLSIGKLELKTKTASDDIKIGSLFAKRKENKEELRGAAAIRAASTSGLIDKHVAQVGTSHHNNVRPPDDELNEAQDESDDDDIDALLADSGSEYEPNSNDESETDLNDSLDFSTPRALRKTPNQQNKHHGKKPGNVLNGTDSGSSSAKNKLTRKRPASKDEETPRKKPTKRRLEEPFNQLLKGVVFTISGFQNPLRSDIRSKALAMGAKYRPDWDNTCTHLVCAFPNTPKFNQVLGQGKIVTKEWVESCYDRRMRLPWRRYALHQPDKKAPESEEEIFEYVERPPSPVDNRRRISPSRSSGEDTEDEIERVRQNQAKQDQGTFETKNSKENVNTVNIKRLIPKLEEEDELGSDENLPSTSKIKNKEMIIPNEDEASSSSTVKFKKKNVSPDKRESPSSSKIKVKKKKKASPEKEDLSCSRLSPEGEDDIYDLDTEEEDEESDSRQWNLPPLPTFFKGLTFHVGDDLSDDERLTVRRYIFAHSGKLVEEEELSSQEIQFFITRSPKEFKKVQMFHSKVVGVQPEWIWKAHDEARIPPTTSFEL